MTPDGTVYVNTWSGVYYGNDTPHEGGFLVALKDTKGTGQADVNVRFGPTFAEGAHGGTGIWLYKNWLYAEINDKIVRYELKSGEAAPTGKPETILSGMPITGDHPMHPFAIDAQGNLFVSMGSATNACEVAESHAALSRRNNPCTELDTRAGIWRYDANKSGQVFSPKERYATGLRNGEGFDFDTSGRLFVTQHGRDQLHEDWPELYTAEQGFDLPAEEVVILKEGANYGWPTCYYDDGQKKRVLAPEYGGDGGKKVGDCDKFDPPVAHFPLTGHRTISRSTKVRNSRRATKAVPSSPSMAHGTERPGRKAATTSCSSRSQTARRPAITSSSPTASPASTRIRAGPRIARQGWRWDLTARSTLLTTRPAASGA